MFIRTEDGSTYTVDTINKTVFGPGMRQALPYVSISACVLHCAFEAKVILDGVVKSVLTAPVSFAHL